MVNSIDNANNSVKNQLITMVNASGKAVPQDMQSNEARLKEAESQNDKEDKKQLESELRELSKKLNDEMKKVGTDINFSYNEHIPGLMVTVKEGNGEKIIREIPSKEAVELMKRMREVIGVIFDRQG